jgi:hypothetical protein
VVALLAVIAVLGVASCDLMGSTSESNENVTVQFLLKDAFSTSTQALSNNPTWSVAEARITEVVFGYDTSTGSFSDTVPTTSKLDLLTGEADPALPGYTLEPGTYESVYFGAELYDEDTTPSIYLEGEWEGTPIRVVFISGEVFEAVAGTLTVEEGETYEISVVLDPDEWFSSMSDADLNGAKVGEDGVIELSDSSNGDLFDTHIAANIDTATQAVLPGGTPD